MSRSSGGGSERPAAVPATVLLPTAPNSEALVRAAGFGHLDDRRVGQFLTATVLRLCVDHYRARARVDRVSARSATAAVGPPVDDEVCDRAEGRWLLAKAASLRGRERQILLARAAGKSTREEAAELSITPKATEAAPTRGRARLIASCRAN